MPPVKRAVGRPLTILPPGIVLADHAQRSVGSYQRGKHEGCTVMTTDQIDQAKDEDDAAYFQRRAEWHRGRASVADDVATRRLHEKFARMYHDRGAD